MGLHRVGVADGAEVVVQPLLGGDCRDPVQHRQNLALNPLVAREEVDAAAVEVHRGVGGQLKLWYSISTGAPGPGREGGEASSGECCAVCGRGGT